MKRRKEMQLESAWKEAVARAEQDEAAADRRLKEVKGELRQLEAELTKQRKLLRGSEKVASDRVVVAASAAQAGSGSPPEETSGDSSPRKAPGEEVGKALGAILVQHGLVDRHHLEEAIAEQKKNYRPIGQILVESGYATEEDIINALVAQAGVPYLPLANYEISEDVASIIPKDMALKYDLMPVDRIAGNLLVAMGVPLNKDQKREVEQLAQGMKITYFISSWSDIKARHEQHYG